METLSIGKLNFENLAPFVEIREKSAVTPNWADVEMIELTPDEKTQSDFIIQRLLSEPAHLLNEATIWARAIYLLLVLWANMAKSALVLKYLWRLSTKNFILVASPTV